MEELKQETEKWLDKIKEKRKSIALMDNSKKDMIKNIDAYISDTSHFLEKKDYIRAFEAVVWAWSWIEILEELEIIKSE
ncbi:MAG: DUF357 domain-containing protein [Candidatus Aenigmarchaeota archaeon]|nr:DUF357 domain-containing protein [Candidatus Aenigmarchaeota archaeon]